jgi:hypothetical protein
MERLITNPFKNLPNNSTDFCNKIGTKLPFAAVQNYVGFLGYSGREMLAVRLSQFDPTRTWGNHTQSVTL